MFNKKSTWILILSVLIVFFTSFYVLGQQKGNENSPLLSVIVIDPGHGGKDPGTVVANVREKDIVLDISLKLGNLIKMNFPEMTVLYTRKTDVFIPLNERALVANKNNAQLFISLHANYAPSPSVRGTETFTLGLHRSLENLEVAKKENAVILLEDNYEKTYEGFDPSQVESYIMFENIQEVYSEQSILFASETQNQFRELAKRYDRSVKQAGFIVLRQAAMPSVLIETGFISNENERNYLMTDKGRAEIALSIFQAFKNYKRRTEQKSTFQAKSEKTVQPITEIPAVIDSTTAIKTVDLKPVTTENVNTPPVTVNQPEKKPTSGFYSVQLFATSTPINPQSAALKGEKNTYSVKIGNFYKYFAGMYSSLEVAESEKIRLQKKFAGAFIVTNAGGVITPVK